MSEHAHAAKSYKGKKALLVDNDIESLGSSKSYLEKMGFECIIAETQAEAEKIIEEQKFDLAVVGLMLEFKDSGFILCYRIKKKNPDIPAIIVTNVISETGMSFDLSSPEERSWIKADAILEKQIRFEQLEREVSRLIA